MIYTYTFKTPAEARKAARAAAIAAGAEGPGVDSCIFALESNEEGQNLEQERKGYTIDPGPNLRMEFMVAPVKLVAHITGQDGADLGFQMVEVPFHVWHDGEARDYVESEGLVDLGDMEGFTLYDAGELREMAATFSKAAKEIEEVK